MAVSSSTSNNGTITRSYPFQTLPTELKAGQIESISQVTLAKFAEANKRGMPIEQAVSEGDFTLKNEFNDHTQNMSWEELYNRDNLFLCMMMIKAGKAFTKEVRNRVPSFIRGDLNECNCRNPVARNSTDSLIIREIERRFPDKSKRLTYVSFGSEGCFSDWVILSQLSLLGYKNIDVHLTAPTKKAYDKMAAFFSQFPGADFKIFKHDSLREFGSLQKPCDILLALDFNGDFDKEPNPFEISINDNGLALSATHGAPTDPSRWPNCNLKMGAKALKTFRPWTKEG